MRITDVRVRIVKKEDSKLKAVASITIDATSLTSGTNFWRSAIISAFAAGLSAVKTAALNIISKKEKL